MKNILKIKFDFTFYIFLFLVFISGMFKEFSFLFCLLFFHEMGHALMGILFNWKIVKITFYPYGGITLFSKFENSSIFEEIFILLSGPIMQIATYFVLITLFSYSYIKNYHYSLLIFNLLPIFSLDGGKLINLIFNYFFNFKVSFILSMILSFLVTILLILFCFYYYYNFNLFLMSLFLVFKGIKGIRNFRYIYHKFLLERYLYNFPYRKIRVSKDIKSFYRECYHYISFQEEKKYLQKYFCEKKS